MIEQENMCMSETHSKRVCMLITVAICVNLPTTAQGQDSVPHWLKLQHPVLGKRTALMAWPCHWPGCLAFVLICGFVFACSRERGLARQPLAWDEWSCMGAWTYAKPLKLKRILGEKGWWFSSKWRGAWRSGDENTHTPHRAEEIHMIS